MTAQEFNEKYSSYLEENHYGALGHDNVEFLDWLDEKFQLFITYPGFKFSQIKSKFSRGYFTVMVYHLMKCWRLNKELNKI